ncbi:MAG: DUF4870 domain-containing protein [Patescibacteria group bacterium]
MQEGETIKNEVTSANSQKPQIEPNIMAALSYAVPLVMGVVIFIMEKENKFVRFHAFQSIIFGLCWAGVAAIASSLHVLLIGFVLSPLVTVAGVALWFFLMWKAYNNQEYQLPFVGKIAYDQTHK